MLDVRALRLVNAADALIDRHLREGRDQRVVYRFQQRAVTYEQLAGLTRRAGAVFGAAGIEAENRVVLVLPDSPVLVAAVLGLLRIGAVPVPLSPRLAADEYAAIVADCRPKGLVLAPEVVASFERARAACASCTVPWPHAIWVVDGDAGSPHPSFEAALAQADDCCAMYPTSADSIAVLQYTSGSTGRPKGVVHPHRALMAVTAPVAERLQLTEADLIWSAAKMSFGYGFGNSLLFPLSLGASAVLYSGLVDPLRASEIVRQHRPSVLFGVPGLYAGLLNLPPDRADVDCSSLRLCVSAGEHLSAELARRWEQRFGLPIVDAIGATECLHIFMAGEIGRLKAGSVGTPLTGCEAKLVGDSAGPVLPGEVGELHVKGPFIASRYWRNHDKTIATMVGPWVRTRDLFYADHHGDFFHVGRCDDVIKVGGLKVAPREIEDCLLRHPSVAECCVVAAPVPREERSRIVAYVRLRPGIAATRAVQRQLNGHMSEHLAVYKRPERVEFVDELPVTSTGKLARFRLREVAQQC